MSLIACSECGTPCTNLDEQKERRCRPCTAASKDSNLKNIVYRRKSDTYDEAVVLAAPGLLVCLGRSLVAGLGRNHWSAWTVFNRNKDVARIMTRALLEKHDG